MISTPFFKKFRVSEYIQFFTDVRNLCVQYEDIALQVQDKLDSFTANTKSLEDTFKANHASEITAQLRELDAQRDQAIICLRKVADAYTDHFKPVLSSAGRTLVNCIDKYGSRIYSMNYQAETSTLSNLGDELTGNAEMKSVVAILRVGDVVAEMIRLNNEFNTLYLSRVSERTFDQTISSGEAIKQVLSSYYSLTEHLHALFVITPSESVYGLLAEINTLIDRYNTTMEQRAGRKNGTNEEAEEAA